MQLKTLLTLGLVATLLLTGPAAAAPSDSSGSEEEDSGDTIVNIDLSQVVDAVEELIDELQDFTGEWDETLKEILVETLFEPFLELLEALVEAFEALLTYTPAIESNPAVQEVHQDTLIVTYLLSGLGFAFAGLLYMIGPLLGVSYSEARQILPRMVLALIFASVSLPLLQYSVDLSGAFLTAFKPELMETSLRQMAGTSAAIAAVWLINSWLLLLAVIAFVLVDTYILLIAAISPLIALGWSLPKVKKYADSFIAAYWAALAVKPLDMLVLKFSFALMNTSSASLSQDVANWIYGMACFALLLWLPLQLYGASQTGIGQAYALTRSVKHRVRKHRQKKRRKEYREKRLKQNREKIHRNNRRRRGGR